jgi:hypothetical protein
MQNPLEEISPFPEELTHRGSRLSRRLSSLLTFPFNMERRVERLVWGSLIFHPLLSLMSKIDCDRETITRIDNFDEEFHQE